MSLLRRATSVPVLGVLLVVLTVLAMGPLQWVDRDLHGYWSFVYTPDLTRWLRIVDSVAGQKVAVPVLAAVALAVAVRVRSWEPLRMVVLAEAAFFGGLGTMKVLLARGSTSMHEPRFFAGEFDGTGWHGISYPSGHTGEAVLLYGAAVYLVFRYLRPGRGLRTALLVLWGYVILQSVAVSYYLGFHWISDLLAGVLAGGILLHVIVWIDRWFHSRRSRVLLPARLDEERSAR
ncbi:phosphatase PAP2 family protein [Kytococcus sp. Marseille-QA3725]